MEVLWVWAYDGWHSVLCPWVKHFILCLVLAQPRKTHPKVTEKLLTGALWIKTIYNIEDTFTIETLNTLSYLCRIEPCSDFWNLFYSTGYELNDLWEHFCIRVGKSGSYAPNLQLQLYILWICMELPRSKVKRKIDTSEIKDVWPIFFHFSYEPQDLLTLVYTNGFCLLVWCNKQMG